MIMTDGEHADALSRRRARMLPFLAVIYMAQQASYFSALSHVDRTVDHFKVGAWVILSLVLLALLSTKGFWFRKRAVRDLIDDESTKAHRLEALKWGFLMSVGTSIAVYFVDQFTPLTTREAVHLIVSLGLGAALIRFGMLERRAHRG